MKKKTVEITARIETDNDGILNLFDKSLLSIFSSFKYYTKMKT